MMLDFGEACPYHWFFDKLIEAKATVEIDGRDVVIVARASSSDHMKSLIVTDTDEDGQSVAGTERLIKIDDIERVWIY